MKYLFRGRRTDNKKWVYGSYLHLNGSDLHIIVDEMDGEYHRVDPDTVGEWIRTTDKHGVKIFEGDIVALDDYDDYEVEFDAEEGRYIAIYHGGRWNIYCDEFDFYDCVVVDNIWERGERDDKENS